MMPGIGVWAWGTWADTVDLEADSSESLVYDIDVIRHPFYKVTIVFPKGLDTATFNPRLSVERTNQQIFTIDLSELFVSEGGVEQDEDYLKGKLQNDVKFNHWHVLWRAKQYGNIVKYLLIPRSPFDETFFDIEVCGFKASNPKQAPVIVEYRPRLEDFEKAIESNVTYTNTCP